MPRLLIPILISLGLAACEDPLPSVSEADQAVQFGYAELSISRQVEAEVRVRLTNPSRHITTERYAACIVASAAQARGFVWVERLRGRRRIDGAVEDLAVLYILHRLEEPEGDAAFTAALFSSLCRIDGIPTEPEERAGEAEVPELSLGGRGAPVEGPGATAPPESPPTVLGDITTPEPEFDPPPVDPVDGI
ncbi:MAG: hypothetical protein AAFY59_05905 [Pseudomonadota bacterium]